MIGDAHAPGATPLDPDEARGLIPRHIRTQAELNQWEQANVLEGSAWAMRARERDVLSERFVRELHRRLFGNTWRWAGTFRATGKNIGVDAAQVAVQLRELLENTRYWIEHRIFVLDETAVRFHHRLVAIHPFPNGNGRHARLMTDVLLRRSGAAPFSWGGASLEAVGDARDRYLAALRAADTGNYPPLLDFVRS
ncbi:MAG: mobile mystery protein B [Burkholderiales bacterium]|nr:mobile mystery protein B [Burkholderiales bacterium]